MKTASGWPLDGQLYEGGKHVAGLGLGCRGTCQQHTSPPTSRTNVTPAPRPPQAAAPPFVFLLGPPGRSPVMPPAHLPPTPAHFPGPPSPRPPHLYDAGRARCPAAHGSELPMRWAAQMPRATPPPLPGHVRPPARGRGRARLIAAWHVRPGMAGGGGGVAGGGCGRPRACHAPAHTPSGAEMPPPPGEPPPEKPENWVAKFEHFAAGSLLH